MPKPMATTTSLPLSALLMFLVRSMYLGLPTVNSVASVVQGLHEAIVPLSIIAGAVFLFESMEATGCMAWMLREMKALTNGHVVAEVMLIAWAFAYVVEGASGFGTPAALAAPLLVNLGHSKFESICCVLLTNACATTWGAVGTPIWFGFGNLGLTQAQLVELSFKVSVCVSLTATILMPFIVGILVPRKLVKENGRFILLSTLSCLIPNIAIASSNYEFPVLAGGMIGITLTSLLIKFQIGLRPYNAEEAKRMQRDTQEAFHRRHNVKAPSSLPSGSEVPAQDPITASAVLRSRKQLSDAHESLDHTGTVLMEAQHHNSHEDGHGELQLEHKDLDDHFPLKGSKSDATDRSLSNAEMGEHHDVHTRTTSSPSRVAYFKELAGRTFPMWGTLALLILTRVDQIGFKDLITRTSPNFQVNLGTYGIIRVSASLVFSLLDIMTDTSVDWSYQLLYVPFILPFIVVSSLTLYNYRHHLTKQPKQIVKATIHRLHEPLKATMGALVLVSLIRNGGTASPAYRIGYNMSTAMKEGWIAISALLGVLGSFFSGSSTVANLTFGTVQYIAGQSIGVDPLAILGLQACGATAGTGVCIYHIIAAVAVVGQCGAREGVFIYKTSPIVFAFCILCTIFMLCFFIRF